jgi:hypothetical protein
MAIAAILVWGAATAPTYARAAGRPQFDGIYTNATETPLERPAEFVGPTVAAVEAAAYEKARVAAFEKVEDGVGGRQSEWWERGSPMVRIDGAIRSSLVVDPPDGKLPYTPAGRKALADGVTAQLSAFNDPEVRPSSERCLTGGSGSTGTPIFPGNYSSFYQFVLTEHHLAIAMEVVHEVRIIEIGARRPAPPEPRRWAGNSVGWWEGQTLVVETRGFMPGDAYKAPGVIYISPQAKVTERFSRTPAGEILYAFEVDDPGTFSRTWRAEKVFRPTTKPMFEFACHEGNTSVEGILAGARQVEAADRK